MSANYMLLKSCKIFKKAEAVTSSTTYLFNDNVSSIKHSELRSWL